MRIAFDFDGVLCLTPFGRLAVHAPKPVPDLPPDYERLYAAPAPDSALRLAVEYVRFGWRRSAPQAHDVLRGLSADNELYIVTGRSVAGISVIRRWLRRHRLEEHVAGVRMAPPGMRPPQHKLATAIMLRIDVHIDDDPRTAYHLAESDVSRVFLLDHAGAHGDAPLPERLTLVRSLADFAARVRESDRPAD
jgi:hypothetical protein